MLGLVTCAARQAPYLGSASQIYRSERAKQLGLMAKQPRQVGEYWAYHDVWKQLQVEQAPGQAQWQFPLNVPTRDRHMAYRYRHA